MVCDATYNCVDDAVIDKKSIKQKEFKIAVSFTRKLG